MDYEAKMKLDKETGRYREKQALDAGTDYDSECCRWYSELCELDLYERAV